MGSSSLFYEVTGFLIRHNRILIFKTCPQAVFAVTKTKFLSLTDIFGANSLELIPI